MTQRPPVVHVIAVGDELRSGRRQDTNGPWMAAQLTALGVAPTHLHVVGDDPEALADFVRDAARAARLLVMCGGLGPTGDDSTRQALAQALDAPLQESDAAWGQVQARLAAMGRTPNALQRTQALLPEGAAPLENPVGTAPGVRAQLGDTTLFALPGVPVEMRAMFTQHVVPFVAAQLGQDTVAHATLWTACMPESEIATRLEALPEFADVTLGYYPHHSEVEVIVQAPEAAAIAAFTHAARRALGDAVFDPPPGGQIEHAVVAALTARQHTVATAESLTGGLIAQMLTAVPGASAVLGSGWVTYAVDAKCDQLGVSRDVVRAHGVVSEPVARAMAEGARERAGADYALATTGVAGPGPLQDGAHAVPAGRAFVALASQAGTEVLQIDGARPRGLVRRYVAVAALDLLRRTLQAGRGGGATLGS